MKPYLRIALPPLAELGADTRMAFVLVDRHGRVLRSGEHTPVQLAALAPGGRAQAVLSPGDAVVATVDLPPVPTRRLDAAVLGRIEPMVLGTLDDVCVAHGPQNPDGTVHAVWASRAALMRGWQILHEAGIRLDAIVPLELALPAGDARPHDALALPADGRWLAPLPPWSLARPEWRPARHTQRWRAPLRWAAAAAVLWIAGLNLYAAQLRSEVEALQRSTEQAVRDAFPSISAVIDPLRQARNQRDMLRSARGVSGQDDFMPLALAAAQVLGFAAGHVAALHYQEDRLTLVLADGYSPPTDETTLHAAAAASNLALRKDNDAAHTWHIQRADTPGSEVHR